MGQFSIKASGNKEYLDSDRWKCKESPNGAHYWIIRNYEMTCKYCRGVKLIAQTGYGLPKPESDKPNQI